MFQERHRTAIGMGSGVCTLSKSQSFAEMACGGSCFPHDAGEKGTPYVGQERRRLSESKALVKDSGVAIVFVDLNTGL